MNPGTYVTCEGSTFFEDPHWHHRFLGDIFLDGPEADQTEDSNNDGGNDIGRVPREENSSGGQTEKERCWAADEDDDTENINPLDFLLERCGIGFESEKEINSDDNDNDDWDVDVEDPAY